MNTTPIFGKLSAKKTAKSSTKKKLEVQRQTADRKNEPAEVATAQAVPAVKSSAGKNAKSSTKKKLEVQRQTADRKNEPAEVANADAPLVAGAQAVPAVKSSAGKKAKSSTNKKLKVQRQTADRKNEPAEVANADASLVAGAQAVPAVKSSAEKNAKSSTKKKLEVRRQTADRKNEPAGISAISAYLQAIGLFDPVYYKSTYPDIAKSEIDPSEHFFRFGFAEGRRPNPIFDPLWYLNSFPDVKASGMQPLLHYAQFGEREGRRPSPLFDPAWYRKKYNVPSGMNALAHYFKHRVGPYSPIPEFDAKYYLETFTDIAAAKVDPFEHFMRYGYREGRNPSAEFDTQFYIRRYLNGKTDANPLLHFLTHHGEKGIFPRAQENEATIPAQVKRFSKPGPDFEEFRPLQASTKRHAKVLAFYLTQFHTFPENDSWWGTGFTEWTNIARGLPRFKDHYQPRVPRDLGFYSLDHIDPLRKQVAMAKASGISGFVFYYYWFNQRRLMEKPLEQFLQASDIEMPFCLMWANENWTRRWDGLESEVLISQEYRPDDDKALLADFVRHFKDPRYIRLQGRPLLMIYRPGLIPKAADVIARWRSIFKESFGEDPIIVMSQSFNNFDPRDFGMDGALEFPPHKITARIPRAKVDEVYYLDDAFTGQIFNYDDVVRYSLEEPSEQFPLIKSVVPSWDNDARRQGAGLVVHGSTPAKYEAWLSALVERAAREPFFGEPIVCVNAWNEWAEGTYLEPDLHFGSAYLNATARAVAGLSRDASRPRLLLVGHDAFPSGAQQLLLNIGKTLRSAFGVDIEYLLLSGGELEDQYAAMAPGTVLKDPNLLSAKIRNLRERGFAAAIVNTMASAQAAALLAETGARTVLLVHELPRLIVEKGLVEQALAGTRSASEVVFASRFVRDSVIRALSLSPCERFRIRPQGTYKQITVDPAQGALLRRQLAIPPQTRVVLGVGYADMRKGFDLFLQAWRLMRSIGAQAHFCWVGGMDPMLAQWLGDEISAAKATGTFHLVGFQNELGPYYSAADAFALTSREDPFPTVALEAMSAGVPVLAFDRTGGIPEFLKQKKLGFVVPYCDVPSMVAQLQKLFNGGWDEEMRAAARDTIELEFAFVPYVRDLLRLALPDLPAISVIVPNYNYAHYLPERLNTIFDQTHPVEEIIVLDDASSDNSLQVINDVAEERARDLTLFINDENTGSAFAQWRKAAEVAVGEFVWIAEADDASEPTFLSSMLMLMRADPDVQIGFCDSKSIGSNGAPVYASYKPYFATVEPSALSRTEIFDGRDFARRFLSVKNLILNVSSVVWRRDALQHALNLCREDLADYRVAGDWRLYLECLFSPGAKLAYLADPLNVHRRHAESVTHSLKAQRHIDEISRIHKIARERLNLGKTSLQLQRHYIEEVTRQLMGSSEKTGVPAEHNRQSIK